MLVVLGFKKEIKFWRLFDWFVNILMGMLKILGIWLIA